MKLLLTRLGWATIVIGLASLDAAAHGQTAVSSPITGSGGPSPAKVAEAATTKDDQAKQNKGNKVIGGGQTANETKDATPDNKSKAARILRVREGDELSVEVPDLKERIEKQPSAVNSVKLFLDCKPVEGLIPIPRVSEKKILFVLDREAMEQITSRTKIVSVGVSFQDPKNPEILMPEKVQLVLVACDRWLFLVIAIVFLVALLVWSYGRYTNLLRDGRPPSKGGAETSQTSFFLKYLPGFKASMPIRTELAAYSLAKVQMAWWFFFIVSAFLFIWLSVGDFNSLTTSTLVLFGISVGTTVASKMVGSSKQSTAQELTAKTGALQQQVTQLNATPNVNLTPLKQDLDTKTVQLAQAQTQLSQLTVSPDEAKSQGLLTDIMSDENGISIHRFQMVVWTAVLTLIFVHEVYKNLAMPQFSDTLLTLMGISSGTYVALKVPEKHSVVV